MAGLPPYMLGQPYVMGVLAQQQAMAAQLAAQVHAQMQHQQHMQQQHQQHMQQQQQQQRQQEVIVSEEKLQEKGASSRSWAGIGLGCACISTFQKREESTRGVTVK